jgi:hypothetical protein
MRSQAYTYMLGIVAMLAGVAIMVFSSSRLIDIFGGTAMICRLGSTNACATGRPSTASCG